MTTSNFSGFTELTPLLNDRPTRQALTLLHSELNANAMSIPSNRGGGDHGHLALVLSVARYTTVAGQAFVTPVHPGDDPVIPPAASRHHCHDYLNQPSLQIPPRGLHHLPRRGESPQEKPHHRCACSLHCNPRRHFEFAFAQVSTIALLNHLDSTYGTITESQLAANLAALQQPYDTTAPIEALWTRIADCQQFAATVDAISDFSCIRIASELFRDAGQYPDALRTWHAKAEEDKTLDTFKVHFNAAEVERRLVLTSSQARFLARTPAQATPPEHTTDFKDFSYCWSHGLGRTLNHTSLTCPRKLEGHQDTATLSKLMGGSSRIIREPNDPPQGVHARRRNNQTT